MCLVPLFLFCQNLPSSEVHTVMPQRGNSTTLQQHSISKAGKRGITAQTSENVQIIPRLFILTEEGQGYKPYQFKILNIRH
jgi:hypothetical protein